MKKIIICDNKSFNFLDDKNQWDIIVAWHPLISTLEDWSIEIKIQESAFLNAIRLYKKKWWELVIRFSNSKNSHKDFLKNDVATWKSHYKLSELSDNIVESYRSLLWENQSLLGEIHVVFQNQANGYIKSSLTSKKLSNSAWAIKNLLLSKGEIEYKTNCRWTFAWLLKLTWKINETTTNILVCLWADNWSSSHDMAWWISGAKNIMWLKHDSYYAYFDDWKNVPMIKCG